jgi:hypothetical protein
MGSHEPPAHAPLLARPTAPRDAGAPSLVLMLLAFLACLACAGIRHDPGVAGRSLSHSDHAVRDGDQLALGQSTPEPARFERSSAEPPASEREALEPDDVECDARLEAAAPSMDCAGAPGLPLASKLLQVASTGWMPQFLLSPALPRGPPALGG